VRLRQQTSEQPVVGVSEDARALERGEALDDRPRLGPAGSDVSEADNAVGAAAVDVVEDGVERDRVPVDVGDDRDAAHEREPSQTLPRREPTAQNLHEL